MTTRAYIPRLFAAAVAVGALTLTGCGPSEPTAEESPAETSAAAEPTATATEAAPESSETASAEPSESSEPSPSESAPASASPSASAGAAADDDVCTADMLSAVLETEMGGGAAGSVYRQIIFTNTTDAECEITGYPGVSYVDAAGTQVGAPADREPGESATVVLGPGESAIAPVKQTYAENYGAECELTDVAGLRVYPPNDTDSLVVDQTGTACAAEDVVLMTVAPTKPLAP